MSSHVRSRLRVAIGRIAALVCLGLFAIPAVAFASCPVSPVTTPFAQWGDSGNYFLLPGGSFEGTPDQVGWELSGASLTSGNEPFYVNDSGDTQSLTIDGGGSATSPFFCVDNTMTSLRFFAQQTAHGAGLRVRALVQNSDGSVNSVPVARLADGSMSDWTPTDAIPGDTSGLSDDQTLTVALQFTVRPSAASWQIDDLYVDPYRSG